jgi:hypothetical protein
MLLELVPARKPGVTTPPTMAVRTTLGPPHDDGQPDGHYCAR